MTRIPRTRAEANERRYHPWAGNPNGTEYKPDRCAYEVWDPGGGMRTWQCQRKPGHGPDGLYCRAHAKIVARMGGEQ